MNLQLVAIRQWKKRRQRRRKARIAEVVTRRIEAAIVTVTVTARGTVTETATAKQIVAVAGTGAAAAVASVRVTARNSAVPAAVGAAAAAEAPVDGAVAARRGSAVAAASAVAAGVGEVPAAGKVQHIIEPSHLSPCPLEEATVLMMVIAVVKPVTRTGTGGRSLSGIRRASLAKSLTGCRTSCHGEIPSHRQVLILQDLRY